MRAVLTMVLAVASVGALMKPPSSMSAPKPGSEREFNIAQMETWIRLRPKSTYHPVV